MRENRKVRYALFFLSLGLVASGILLAAADFGESSASLGQFTDDFIDLNNVSVQDNVIRNSTLNAMELNYTLTAGFFGGWGYRKAHNITGTAVGIQTDYPVGIKIYYGSGTDGTETVDGNQFGKVYLDSKCRTDFGDIRFTNSDGITELDYWIQSKINSNYAIIWIEVDTIPQSPNTVRIYIYYGKANETTTSNGDDTFLLFDHFLGTSINASKWNVRDGTPTVSGSYLELTGTVGTREQIESLTQFPIGKAIHERVQASQANQFDNRFLFMLTGGGSFTQRIDIYPTNSNNDLLLQNRIPAGTNNEAFSIPDFTAWGNWELTWKTGQTRIYLDGTLEQTNILRVPTTNLRVYYYEGSLVRGTIFVDWVFVRKWVDPEPTHGAWGVEEAGEGYEGTGYFTTVDYLSSINGSTLAHLTNTTIPGGTGITVEYSEDNSTWILNDWDPLFGGHEAVDLRDLNYSAGFWTRFNMSGSPFLTPRVYQSRLITTEGPIVIVTGAPGQNVSGEWVAYNLTEIGVTVGILDSGDLNSTLDIDGDLYNVSEVVGAPGMQISGNFSGVDPDAGCLWVVIYAHYDGNLNHDFDIEVWNFTSSAWVEDSHITDGIELTWFNSTIYALRIPNEFLSGGEVRVRLDHESPGNINHDLFIEYFKLLAEIPAGPSPGAGAVINIIESDFPWIAIAIILMCVAYLLFRPK